MPSSKRQDVSIGAPLAQHAETLHAVRISVDDLHQFVAQVLRATGVSESDARTTADVLVTTDSWGVFTHGTKLLGGYVNRLRGGGLRKNSVPEVVRQGAGWALVDGQSSLGMVTSTMAMNLATQKARDTGIGWVGVRNSCHFGAAGYYAVMAAQSGLIGLATANDAPSMTAPGARGRMMGTNPWAFAAPAGEENPIFLDIALSTVAGGKVYAARTLGKSIPENWAVDKEGVPTTDPAAFHDGGSLQPMAGHKGYGLALMVEILSGLLTGAGIRSEILSWINDDPSRPTGHGACFIAIDVASILPLDQFKARMDAMIRDLRAAPKARGSDRIYVPGEMEWERRAKALTEGIVLPPDVAVGLTTLASDTGVKFHGTIET